MKKPTSTTPPANAAGRKFYFMVAAEVVFQLPAGENEVALHTAKVNGVITHTKDQIPSNLLGQAQKVAQMQLFKKMGDDSVTANVLDVVILNVMQLGYMTEEEFQAVPEGVKQQEVAKTVLSVVKGGKPANDGDVLDPAALAAQGTLQ
jgi:hypothetical protein